MKKTVHNVKITYEDIAALMFIVSKADVDDFWTDEAKSMIYRCKSIFEDESAQNVHLNMTVEV